MTREIELAASEIFAELEKILPQKVNKEFYVSAIYNYVNSPKYSDKDELLAKFFIWVWIDQTIYWVLVDKRNKRRIHDEGIYQQFKLYFPFPKIWLEGMSPIIRPRNLLSHNEINIAHNLKLLKITKLKWWDGLVKQYFIEIDRPDIINLAEEEFRKDLTLRHRFNEEQENALIFLWE